MVASARRTEVKEENAGLRRAQARRKKTTKFIGVTWALIITGLISMASMASLYVTGFLTGKPLYDDHINHRERDYIKSDLFAVLVFGSVIGVIITLIVPYMLAIARKQESSTPNDTAIDVISTGTHRGMSRFHSRHENIYGEVET